MAPERGQGGHPVDRLGDPGRLVDVEGADVADEPGRGLDQGHVRGRRGPPQDGDDPLRLRVLQPVVEAAPPERVVQLAAPVGGEHHDRRLLRDERAQLRHRHRSLAERLEQQRLELVVGAVDLVDEQHRRARAVVAHAAQDRPLHQELLAEQVRLGQRLVLGLGQPDREQLALVVPVVERLVRGQPLVALEPDQRRLQHPGQDLRRGRLAHARLTLEQQRQPQLEGEVDGGRQALVREVVLAVEAAAYVVRGRERAGHGPASSSAW